MNWIVNIETKKDQRILVKFDPQNELVWFIGQYKPHNKEWIDFSTENHSMIITLDEIKECIEKVYDTMKKRLDAYHELSDGFSILKNIEIKKE